MKTDGSRCNNLKVKSITIPQFNNTKILLLLRPSYRMNCIKFRKKYILGLHNPNGSDLVENLKKEVKLSNF